MKSLFKDELHRFWRVFLSYTKAVCIGAALLFLFSFVYAGVKANYVSVEILTVAVTTIAFALFAYFAISIVREFITLGIFLSKQKLKVEFKEEIDESKAGEEKRLLKPGERAAIKRRDFLQNIPENVGLTGKVDFYQVSTVAHVVKMLVLIIMRSDSFIALVFKSHNPCVDRKDIFEKLGVFYEGREADKNEDSHRLR